MFLKISQNSQENRCVGVFFLINLQTLYSLGNHQKTYDFKGNRRSKTLFKRLQHRCFPVNIAKFLRTPILKNICERLLPKGVLQKKLLRQISPRKVSPNLQKNAYYGFSFLSKVKDRQLTNLDKPGLHCRCFYVGYLWTVFVYVNL